MGKPSRKHTNPVMAARRQLVPHTSAWFAQLERLDPGKARMTRAVLARAGRTDACTICGDVPAPVCDLAEAPWLSLRLCAECHHIRTTLAGERFERRYPATGDG